MSKRTKMLRNESEQMAEKISKEGRQVLEEIPRLTAGQKVMMTIRDMCGVMSVLFLLCGGLYLALSAGYGDLNSVGPAYTTVTSGMLLQVVIITAAGTWFARIYYPNPYKGRVRLWLQYTVPVIIVVFISSRVAVILKQPLFTIHAVLLVPIAVILLIIYKIIDSRVG